MALLVFLFAMFPAHPFPEAVSAFASPVPISSGETDSASTDSLLIEHVAHVHCFADGLVLRLFNGDPPGNPEASGTEYPPECTRTRRTSGLSPPFKPPRA